MSSCSQTLDQGEAAVAAAVENLDKDLPSSVRDPGKKCLDLCATLIIWYVLENICIQTDNFHCGSPLGEGMFVLSVGW